ncbi:FISUMP domain-containing protein [Salinivirga cyanobacteriivorans]
MKHKQLTILMLAFLSTLFIYTACEEDKDELINNVPTCNITSPEDGAEFTHGDTLNIIVEASDQDDNLQKVKLYVNDIELASLSSLPYNFDWDTSEEEAGTFIIKAESVDETQKKAVDSITITLNETIVWGDGVTDIDGNNYISVIIGNQEWMAENLKTTTYNTGTAIDLVTDNADWDNYTTGAYCWYDNDEATYGDIYGALYNWYTVETGSLCPDGWHVPTDNEWKTLEMNLGISQSEIDEIDFRGTNEGSMLAGNAELWNEGELTNNIEFGSSNFTALPSGFRSYNGSFTDFGNDGGWWTATVYDSDEAWLRIIDSYSSKIFRYYYFNENGLSVRCIKD